MVRLAPLVVVLSGCDLVLGADFVGPPAVCGPYAAPERVQFHPDLVDAHDLSVVGDRGLVHARFAPTGLVEWTGPHAVRLENETWVPDLTRDRTQLDQLDGGHLVLPDTVLGWRLAQGGNLPTLDEYRFTSLWSPQVPTVERGVDNVRAGNMIALPLGPAMIYFLVELIETSSGAMRIVVLQKAPPRDVWDVTGQADPLQSPVLGLEPSGAVMSADHEVLVYAGSVKGGPSRIYATHRERDLFQHGPAVSIRDVPADADLTEPWIDETCETLYFRWDDATWRAREETR